MPNDYLLLKQRTLYMQQLAGQMTELTALYSLVFIP